jgi:uncharacterized membrane protein
LGTSYTVALDEKKEAKESLEKLMEKLNEMSDHEIDVTNGMFLCLNYFLLVNFIY